MDLDSDLLYLGGSGGGGASAAGSRSFTSYAASRERIYDKYDRLVDRYADGGLTTAASTNNVINTTAITNTTTNTNHHSTIGNGYRPTSSILGGSGLSNPLANKTSTTTNSFTASAINSTAPLVSATSALYSSSGATNAASAAIDKLISSSSASILQPYPSAAAATTSSTAPVSRPLLAGGYLPTTGVGGLAATTTSSYAAAAAAGGGGGANAAGAPSSRTQSNLGHNLLMQLFDDMRQIEDTVDSIEIPARGRCRVYMAKYGYDPFKQSPNENPDAELAFNAGDYIMVFDDIDEDGYFIGELMDGRRGYVPSNWLDRLTGEDLFEFQATTLYKQQPKDDESESNSYPPEFYDAIVSETMNHSNFQHLLLAPEDYHRMNDYVDLNDVNEVDDECLSDYERAEAEQMRRAVPPPQRLVLERQLNKSILIGWLHPQAAKGTIVSYQVYVDGVLKSTVPSGDRTKALLEGVDSNIPHRISVRAIDLHGRHSNDAGCTVVIGQKIPFAPSCVKASHITSDSALISWLPCNSNFHHVVAVNSVEVQTVRPGVYKHLINGLSANTLYRVWVRAKPGKILSIDEKNPKKLESLTTYVDFKTMPKSLPDPPVNVQVEAGPQRRTLLVTWLPLTLNDFGSSNGCAVTGYAVFAGHKKLADIDSPTGDHALLDLSDLESLHKKSVTVRTKSGENLSQDSMPCTIPDEYLKSAAAKQEASGGGSQLHRHHGGGSSQHRLSDTNLDRHSPLRHHISRHNASDQKHQQQQQLLSTRQQQQQQQHLQSMRAGGGGHSSRSQAIAKSRQLARSMQNLESDIDSRRSSIPAIEITRETSGSDHINHTESYSEEEFESSMRFRGPRGKGPGGRMNTAGRYRPRQSHSVDGSVPHLGAGGSRYQSGSLAKLRGTPIERDIRFFVALFDYDPATMSPNPNATSEELAFKEGSIIKVIGDKGPDGFYRGELDNHVGFVPCNVVSEIADPNLLYSLHEKNNLQQQNRQYQQQLVQGGNLQPSYLAKLQQAPSNQQQQQQQLDPQQQQQQQQQNGGVKRMTALYDYDPQENSPNADTESEIPFKVGDVIYVYGKMDTDGFYMGEVERTKQRGLVPSNFLREDPLPAGKQPTMQQQQAMFNQVGGGGGGGGAQMMNPMDAFQQQQQRPQNQFIGGPVQQQQQHQGASMGLDSSSMGGAYGGPQAQANQQQQQLNNPIQMRGNIRGVLPAQNQRVDALLQNVTQQNINRPTTLSLGMNSNPSMAGNVVDWNSNTRPQMMGAQQQQMPMQSIQQQQQQLQNARPLDASSMGGLIGNQQLSGQYAAMGMQQGQQQQPVQQQQQQQQLAQQHSMMNHNQAPVTGGVLSNLLSSGKQIIGAATTPRAPNQPGQFPSMNQIGGGGMGMGMTSGAGTGNMAMGDGGNFLSGRSNLMQTAYHQPNDPSQQAHNSFVTPSANQMMQPQQQQQLQQPHQQQQQAHYNTMAMSRGPMGNPMGEEQGGNILNTVKNMFKL